MFEPPAGCVAEAPVRDQGDVTTLANAEVVEQIHEMVESGADEE